MFQFGDFILDAKQQRLLELGSNVEVAIEPKLIELLVLFIEQPNSIITRQDILEKLWAGSIVTDNAINKLIANLRKVLGDNAKKPRYIQTIPKRGYRLVCQVTPIDEIARTQVESDLVEDIQLRANIDPIELNKAPNRLFKIALIVCFALSLFIAWQLMHRESDAKAGYSIALTRAQGVEFSPKIHPDNEHLYYLKESGKNKQTELWFKNINTAVTKRIELEKSISDIIAVTSKSDSTQLLFLERANNRCLVYQALISLPTDVRQVVKSVDKLFDCNDKRIKDIDYHQQQNAIYYTAQPKNFWPNHIYAFDIASQKHRLVTQTEPTGWGHHGIDISPNGEKLLIMSTDSDHKTQLLALDLSSNEVIEGVKFNRPVYQAIWHHDSEQVFYYSEQPAQQIMKSDLNGEGAVAIIAVSEELSSNMSRVPDGENLVFTTANKNYDNRWLIQPSNLSRISNSNVFDSSPALFHHSNQYLFASQRTGLMQLYLVNDKGDEAKIVTNFSQSHSLGYISISPDDKSVLLTLDEKVYLLPLAELSGLKPMTLLKPEYLVFTSKDPIIAIDWQGAHRAALTAVHNGTPELITIELSDKKISGIPSDWAYGFTDIKRPAHFYVIKKQSNRLYRVDLTVSEGYADDQVNQLIDTQIVLPQEFYLAKVDNDILYYVTTKNNREYLHAVSLDDNSSHAKFLLNDLSRFDVSQGKIMVSDVASKEGDIYRTVY